MPQRIDSKVISRQSYCRSLGGLMACFGWGIFTVGVLTMASETHSNALFIIAGFLLAPSWFLLRFADGLFPFSTTFVKQPEEPLS
jgi:hypothetical protein